MAISHILSHHDKSMNLITQTIYETFIEMSDKNLVDKNLSDYTRTMTDKDNVTGNGKRLHKNKNITIDVANCDIANCDSIHNVSRSYESSTSSAASSPLSDVRHSMSDISSSDTDNAVFTDVPYIQINKTLIARPPMYRDKYFRRYRRKIREYMRYDMKLFTIEYKDLSYIRYVAHVENKLFVIEFDFSNTERYEDNLHCSCKIIYNIKTLAYFHTKHARRLYRTFADIVENDLALRFPSIVPYTI